MKENNSEVKSRIINLNEINQELKNLNEHSNKVNTPKIKRKQ